MTEENETLAKRLYRAQRAMSDVEDEVVTTFEIVGLQDFSADWYDESIEIFGCGGELRADDIALDRIRAAGFKLVWLHQPECQPPRGNDCKCKAVKL